MCTSVSYIYMHMHMYIFIYIYGNIYIEIYIRHTHIHTHIEYINKLINQIYIYAVYNHICIYGNMLWMLFLILGHSSKSSVLFHCNGSMKHLIQHLVPYHIGQTKQSWICATIHAKTLRVE